MTADSPDQTSTQGADRFTLAKLLRFAFLSVLLFQLIHVDQFVAAASGWRIHPWALFIVVTLPVWIYAVCCHRCRDIFLKASGILVPLTVVAAIIAAGVLMGAATPELRYRRAMIPPLGIYTFVVGMACVCWIRDSKWLRYFLQAAFFATVIAIFIDVLLPGTFATNAERASGFAMNSNSGAFVLLNCLVGSLCWDGSRRTTIFDGLLLVLGMAAVYFTFARSGLVIYAAIVGTYLLWRGRVSGARYSLAVGTSVTAVILILLMVASVFGKHIPLLKRSTGRNDPLISGTKYRWNERIRFLVGSTPITNDRERTRIKRFYEEWSQQVGEKRPDNIWFPSIAERDQENVRMLLVYRTCELIARRPIWGWGTGFSDSLSITPHNIYLTIWADNGIIGLAAYGWLMIGSFALNWRYRNMQGIALTIVLTLMGVFTPNCFQFKSMFLTLGISLALAISNCKASRDRISANDGEFPREPL